MHPKITLKPKREKPLLNRHPWVFSGAVNQKSVHGGAIQNDDKKIPAGAIVDVCDSQGHFLARGYYNEVSQIRVRVLTWDEKEKIDALFWEKRILRAKTLRETVVDKKSTNAFRLVAAEADGLPGLIVDIYNDWLVVQSSTAGIDANLETIFSVLKKIYPKHNILERSDDTVRKLEGIKIPSPRLVGRGPGRGDEKIDLVEIKENGLTFLVDILHGHKTGFYLDQRENRQELMRWAKERSVLNCFGYTGAFTIAAAFAGAKEVTTIDSSQPALDMLLKNLALNKLARPEFSQVITANVFEQLRAYNKEGRHFDLIVLDPPKLAHNSGQVDKAARAYKDLNRLAFGLLNDGGILMTFSCSGLISADLFQKIIFSASVEANVTAHILKHLSQSPDHPILLTFPESEYLKGLACRVA